MGSYASLQIFEPPGITSDAHTPNFLRDLSNAVYQSQWTDMTQGGLASAQFDCRQDYGDIVDIVFGSYVLWGVYGCVTSAHASSGDGTLTVTGLLNEQFSVGESFPDLKIGDVVMLTDGSNTELFSISNITGSSPTWTLHLDKPGSSALDLPSTLLNNYAIGATVVRLQFQGFLSQRVHSTAFDNQFSVNASGFFNRYAQMLVTENVQSRDGGTWLYTHLLSESGGSELNSTGPGYPGHPGGWPIGTTTFGCSDLASMLVGEIISIGLQEGNKENFTIDSINVANGTFTVHTASTQNHDVGETVSPEGIGQAPSLPDLVIAKSLMTHPNSINVNLQGSDQPMAEMIAAVVRQETGSNATKTWVCWADVLRQVHHVAIDSVPPNIGETKMTIDAPPGSSTFHVADISRIKVGRRVFITGAAGTDSLKVSAIHSAFNSFDTVGSSSFDHPPKDKVVIIYDVTPGFTISQSENGSGVGDTINKIQTTDQDGTQLMNAVIATGTVISANGQVGTTLASAVVAGATSVPCTSMPFENGDTVTLVSVDGVHTENVVITADPVGNTFTCTPLQYNHTNPGIAIVLASGSGAGPRIIMFEKDSIAAFKGYYEGELSSSDITDRASLVKWTKQQIEITAWPLINAAIDLDTASCRIDGRTLMGISGFSDGVPLYLNVAQVQYQWLAATRNATASIQAGQLKSTSGSVLKELANRHAIRDHHKNPRKRPHGFDGHMGGGDIAPNSDNTFALAAATVKFGGSVYQLPAVTSQVAPEGVSFWGVDLSNPAAPALNQLPSVVWNGRSVYAEAIYEATDDDGVDATLVTEFTGIPLWKVEVRGGVIFGVWPLFSTDGVTLSNLPSIALPPAPTAPSVTPSVSASSNGFSADVTLATTFTNLPQDEQTNAIKYYIRQTGTTAWSHKFTRKLSNLPIPPSATLTDTILVHGLPAGLSVDFGASYDSPNGEGPITVIQPAYTLPTVAIPFASITGFALALSNLSDVLITSPANGDVLTYDSSASKWENKPPTGLVPIADSEVLANISGSMATPSGDTLTAILDHIVGTDQGALLVRKASTWQKLVPGTAGNLLTSAGAAADILWAAPGSPPIGIGTSFPGTPATGQPFYRSDLGALFIYDGSAWQNADSLNQLHDTNIASPADRNLLRYDASSSKWKNDTLTAVLDNLFGSTRGTVLYRGASAWSGLSPGTAGQFLQTNGSTGDPVWAAGGGGAASNVFPFPMRQQTAYNSGASGTVAANWGTTATTGDYLLALVTYSVFSGGTITTPAGWSIVLSSVGSGGLSWILYGKTSNGSESGISITKSRSDAWTIALLNFLGGRTVDKTAQNVSGGLIQGKPPALTSPTTGAGLIVGVANDNANVNVMDFSTPDSLCSWASSKQWGYSTLTSCFDSVLIGYWQNKVGSGSLFYPVSMWQGVGTLVSFSLSLT